MIRHSGPLLTALLALLLLAAPLAFGGVVPWAAATLAVLSFCALALAMAAVDGLQTLRPAAFPALAVAAVALLGLIQALPWPAGVVRTLSPEHARIEEEAANAGAGLVPAGEGAGPASAATPRFTLAVSSTRRAALAWAAAAACLLAGAAAGRNRIHRRWLAGAFLAGGLFQVLFGARGWIARDRTLWGIELVSNPARLRGTFVNPNHLALYLGMALPVAFAWGWWAARRARDEPQIERRLLLIAPPCLLWLTLFLGLAFSGSRGGMLAALAAVTVQGVLLPGLKRRWWLAPVGAVVALAGLALVAAVGFEEGLGRLIATRAGDVSVGARLDEYAAALSLWRRFPLAGTGLGTFRDAFPLVQPADLAGTYWHPHSDLLEILVTGGVVAVALAAVGLWAVVRRLFVVLRGRGRSEDRGAALAALGVLAAAGVHACVDFALTMPGNALTLAVLLGAASAAKAPELAEPDLAGQHPASVQALDLQEMEPAADRHRKRKRHGRSGGGRPHRKGSHDRAVEP
ncbi:MAG TPA: O-antigen ligase family protein [Thermoanaerobaculia bacterium]|nr:O-antigen ligase family protein [Thermoanaerobaculia bacterium]